MGSRLLVLWDVDHTLMTTGPIGWEFFRDAFEQATGQPLVHRPEMAGRTELAIFRNALALHGIRYSQDLFDSYADQLAKGHRERSAELAQSGRALPGALAAVTALAATGDVVQSVLTGNVPLVAEAKLTTFGLAGEIDLEVGAYGTDHEDRPRLVPLARDRAAAKYLTPFPASATVLIGDTPSDIQAAHENSTHIVAVASGHFSVEDLRRSGSATVLPSLEDTAAVLQAVFTPAD